MRNIAAIMMGLVVYAANAETYSVPWEDSKIKIPNDGASRRMTTSPMTTTRTRNAQPIRKVQVPSDELMARIETGRQVVRKLEEIILPNVSFRPPVTLVDAVNYFRQVSRDYDTADVSEDQRGVDIVLRLPENVKEPSDAPVIPPFALRSVSLGETIDLVCWLTNMKILIREKIVMIVPSNHTVEREDLVIATNVDRQNARKLEGIILPDVSFRQPATIVDAVEYFKVASRDYDSPEIPLDQRGVNIVLLLPKYIKAPSDAPVIPNFSAHSISLKDAISLVCDVVDMKMFIRGKIVMIVPNNDKKS